MAADRLRGRVPPPADWSVATWLLLGAAGWAAGLLLVALAGAGGDIPRHPDDHALAPALPAPIAPGAAGAGVPPEAYAAIAARPLFSPERRPDPVGGAGGEAPVAVLEQDLVALVSTAGVRVAVMRERVEPFRHHRVREGQPLPAAPGWRLLALEDRAVRLAGPEGERRLALRAFNGEGGEKPTPITAAAEAGSAAAQAAGAPVPDSPSGALTQRFARGTPLPDAPPPGTPATEQAPAAPEQDPEQLAEAIRRRIEARREQLRREAAQRSAEER